MKCDIELINTKKEQEQDFEFYIQSLFVEVISKNEAYRDCQYVNCKIRNLVPVLFLY